MSGRFFAPRTLEELQEQWPRDLDHVSASSLTTFARCPEQWRRRYCLGHRSAPSTAAVWGRADHHAIAHDLEHKRDRGTHLHVDDVRELFALEFDGQVEKEGGLSSIDFGRSVSGDDAKRKAIARAKDQGADLVGLYHAQVSPFLTPVRMEERFEKTFPFLPVRIDGYIDLVADIAGLGQRIIERKTVGKLEKKPKGDWQLQARIYQLVEPLPFEWHQSARTKDLKVDGGSLRLGYDERKIAQTETLLNQLVRQIGNLYLTYGPEHPWPGAITHPWACGYCGFKETCPWWS